MVDLVGVSADPRLIAAFALLIFTATYIGVAIGRWPGLRLDRAGIALTGAALMLAVGALTPEQAYRAIDLDTITLLLGMMIIVAHLRLSGFFEQAGHWATTYAHTPKALLASLSIATGILSAFLVNDAVCLMMTPLAISLTRALRRNPLPYLLAVAMAANIGSVATITGNPQNMMIGTLSKIPYPDFTLALFPVALSGLLLTIALIALSFREEFFGPTAYLPAPPAPVRRVRHSGLMLKTIAVTAGVIGLFFAGMAVAKAAILGGALLLVTRAVKPRRVYREIDGSLLLMFAGLFVVVAGAEQMFLTPQRIAAVQNLDLGNIWVLTTATAALSNLVSNVPAVMMLRPFVPALPDPERAWLIIAMASTLAGNLTLVGSVANLIVAERARASGITISLAAYCRVGIPLTVLTLLLGVLWLG